MPIPKDSLPLDEGAGKPTTGSSASAKSPIHQPSTKTDPTGIKARLVNPAWAEEWIKSRGVSGPVVGIAAAALTSYLTAQVLKKTKNKKLEKLLAMALVNAVTK